MRITFLTKHQIWSEWLLGAKPRHLAKKYGVSVNTIRSWHYREAWCIARAGISFGMRYEFYKRGLKEISFEDVHRIAENRKKRISETQTARTKLKK